VSAGELRLQTTYRGGVEGVDIPEQSPENDLSMKKLHKSLYGNTKYTDQQIVYFANKHKGNARKVAEELGAYPLTIYNRFIKLDIAATGDRPKVIIDKVKIKDEPFRILYDACNHNKTILSDWLGISWHTVFRRCQKMGI